MASDLTSVSRGISRRRLVVGAAWAAPAVLASSPAPASAASCALVVNILTSGLGGGGFDLRIRDSKNTNSATNSDPLSNAASSTTNPVVNMTVQVTDCTGTPVPNATIIVASDGQRDNEPPSQGGELVGFTPATQTSGFGEAPGSRVATVTTDAAGQARVKICTATYSSVDRLAGDIPRSGTWTVTATATGFVTVAQSYTYQLVDGLPLA